MAAYGYGFGDLLYYLESWGIRDIILPFLIIFTVLFAVFQKLNLFGTGSKRYNIILSLSVALLAVIPHATGTYPQGTDIVEIMNQTLPEISLVLVAIIMLLVLLGIVGFKTEKSSFLALVALASVIFLVVIFMKALYPYSTPDWLSWLGDPSTQALIVILLVFGLVVWFVTKEGGQPAGKFKDWIKGWLD